MTAIALAESSGNTDAHNPNGEDSRGLWQINLDAHRDWVEAEGLDLSDPVDNARAAYRVSGGGATISPWTVTHQSKGALYLKHRQAAEAAALAANEPAQGNWSGSRGYGTTVPAGDGGGAVWQGGAPSGGSNVGVAGTQYGGGSVQVAAAQSTPDTRTPEQYAMEEYGYTAFYLQHPEVGPILIKAAQEKWSKEALKGELMKTDWWKTTNETQRLWAQKESENPQQAQSEINGRAAEIMARANQLGYPISRDRAAIIAKDSLRNGWQGAELDGAIGADAGRHNLLKSSFGTALKQTASNFGIPISENTIGSWAERIASGQDTEENFNAWARDQAINMYPTAAAHIQRGGTVQEFFDPYRETAAKVLQVAPDTIDLSDPKWSAALSITDPNGQRRAMRMDEWQRTLMSDDKYEFRYTENAQNLAEDLVDRMKRQMGIIK